MLRIIKLSAYRTHDPQHFSDLENRLHEGFRIIACCAYQNDLIYTLWREDSGAQDARNERNDESSRAR